MRNIFKKQINTNIPVTTDILAKLKTKTYFNGEKIQVNEVVLNAILVNDVIESNDEIPELSIEFIILNERHLDLFESASKYIGRKDIPAIKLKSKQLN